MSEQDKKSESGRASYELNELICQFETDSDIDKLKINLITCYGSWVVKRKDFSVETASDDEIAQVHSELKSLKRMGEYIKLYEEWEEYLTNLTPEESQAGYKQLGLELNQWSNEFLADSGIETTAVSPLVRLKPHFLDMTIHDVRNPHSALYGSLDATSVKKIDRKTLQEIFASGMFSMEQKLIKSYEVMTGFYEPHIQAADIYSLAKRLEAKLQPYLENPKDRAKSRKMFIEKYKFLKINANLDEMDTVYENLSQNLDRIIERRNELTPNRSNEYSGMRVLFELVQKRGDEYIIIETHSKIPDNTFLQIHFLDWGLGYEDDFEPTVGQTGFKEQGGSGLGLASCRGMIEKMGGKMLFGHWFPYPEKRSIRGAVTTILLPVQVD